MEATPPTPDQLTTTKIWILEECYNGTEGEIVLFFFILFFFFNYLYSFVFCSFSFFFFNRDL